MTYYNRSIDNYVIKLLAMARRRALPWGGVSDTHIEHDDWCGFFDGRSCNCDPDIRIVPRINASG